MPVYEGIEILVSTHPYEGSISRILPHSLCHQACCTDDISIVRQTDLSPTLHAWRECLTDDCRRSVEASAQTCEDFVCLFPLGLGWTSSIVLPGVRRKLEMGMRLWDCISDTDDVLQHLEVS